MITDKIKEDNHRIFALMSNYLNHASDFINTDEMEEIVKCGVSSEYAFGVILAAAVGMDIIENEEDKSLFKHYFSRMLYHLNANEFYNNPYYKNIKLPIKKVGNSELKYEKYKAFEGFICNDILKDSNGRQIPQIGYFDGEFEYPAILENNRLWMSITPNEIETMKEPIDRAVGKVLTYGLGLGYYAYMVSEKDNVDSITVVEKK